MFGWFKKEKKPQVQTPEVLGFRLGGAFELSEFKLKLIESDAMFEGASSQQLIQAVGVVRLDQTSRLVRYYTDDDAFIQILQHGATDADVAEVKLVYFYETKPIDTDSAWQQTLADLVKDKWLLDDIEYQKFWENEKPVAMQEMTYREDKLATSTDQFVMVYSREIGIDNSEALFAVAEERRAGQGFERCLVLSTAIDLNAGDFSIIG